jgi:hypothetical protein
VFLQSVTMKISRSAAVVAPVGGVLFGILDFVWIKYVPAPFGGLGNSLAVWAVAAFLLTFGMRWSVPRGIAGAVAFLVIAVPGYYLAAALIQHDDWANLADPNAVLWMALGVVAGVVFGAGGVVARTPGPLRAAATALPGAVLFAEAVIQVRRAGDPSYGVAGPLAAAAVLIGLGLVLTALAGGTWRRRGAALLWTVPMTAAGFALLSVAHFA